MAAPKRPRAGPGRTSRYRPEYADQAKIACAEGGFTDARLAKLFKVAKPTIVGWRQKYPAFAAACQEGKDAFAVATAETCLLKRVEGYAYTEDTYKPVFSLLRPEGSEDELPPAGLGDDDKKMVLVRRVKKNLPPDVAAIRFLLANLEKRRWAERQKTEISGGLDVNLTMPEETGAMLRGIYGQEEPANG